MYYSIMMECVLSCTFPWIWFFSLCCHVLFLESDSSHCVVMYYSLHLILLIVLSCTFHYIWFFSLCCHVLFLTSDSSHCVVMYFSLHLILLIVLSCTFPWEDSDSRKTTWQHNEKNQMLGIVHDNTMRRIRFK
jgi:FlaA1/EpsC-like NDP-sugar epimerase